MPALTSKLRLGLDGVHSCRYCRRIRLVRERSRNQLDLDLHYRQVIRGAQLGCVFFQSALHRLRSSRRHVSVRAARLRGHVMGKDEDNSYLWTYWEQDSHSILPPDEESHSLKIFVPEGMEATFRERSLAEASERG